MMNSNTEFYTVESICGAMSLRKPQRRSLEILEDILSGITPSKTIDKLEATRKIHAKYPIYTDFERDFMSLTFALATGVGKTRLMGAFIAYLYSQKGIRNFFIIAPGTTIYNKLRSDFGDVSNPKYVFKGLNCFEEAPMIITDENYKNRLNSGQDINIFIFNIGKFDKENAQLKKLNEVLGDSFYKMVSSLDDLVVIMDESHHYRADRGMQA
ncbi:MAG: DEAD/DEAH box helicase family protein, partial [Synergistaceae bacterium]|nr:DEAD/DEAH box helicase family protein [Synergistaceae bacterium]